MKVLRFLGTLACCLACASWAPADSLQLRNGRHLQGKYIGGTTTAIGFMSGASVEYFATSEVLVIIFDNSNDSPLSGVQPNPMRGKSARHTAHIARARQTVVTRDRATPAILSTTAVSTSDVPDEKLALTAESESGVRQQRAGLWVGATPTSP